MKGTTMRKFLIILSILFSAVVVGCASPGVGSMDDYNRDIYGGSSAGDNSGDAID